MTEAQTLMYAFNETRALSLMYFNKLKDVDIYRVFELDGRPLNSAAWIMAHLAWAENFLLLQALGGPALQVNWFNDVQFGSPMPGKEDLPGIDTIIAVLKEVHEAANTFVNNLPDQELDTDNVMGLKFGHNTNKRFILAHAIRHEGVHAGHLGWLVKLHQPLKT